VGVGDGAVEVGGVVAVVVDAALLHPVNNIPLITNNPIAMNNIFFMKGKASSFYYASVNGL
jgi:hypothetical protein